MLRWIAFSAIAVLLSGCVTATEYRRYDDGYYYSGYRDEYGNPVHVDGSTYYSPAYEDSGDYYYGDYGYDYGHSNYVDYPYYYSVFWPLNRWYVDPYWHPGFYYGVTYYPRNYFSIGFTRVGGWYGSWSGGYYGPRWSSYYAYSPYRLSWVDHYYDWTPWYRRYPSYANVHYSPRYGNARYEQQWLSRQLRNERDYRQYNQANRSDGGLPSSRTTRYDSRNRSSVADRREALRGADYGSRNNRIDPQVSGFGYRNDGALRDGSTRSAQPVRQSPSSVTTLPRGSREVTPTSSRGAQSGSIPRSATTTDRSGYALPRQSSRGTVTSSSDYSRPNATRPATTVTPAPTTRAPATSTRQDSLRSRSIESRPVTPAQPVVQDRYERVQTQREAPAYRAPSSTSRPQPQTQPRQAVTPTYRQQAPRQAMPATSAPRSESVAPRSYQAPQRSAPSQQAPVRSAPQPAPARESRSESRESSRGAVRESSSSDDRSSSSRSERSRGR
ncbi:MAG: hypothetical protein WCZ65_00100 [Lysobacteraceae bacterium]